MTRQHEHGSGLIWSGDHETLEVLLYPNDEHIRWYREITRVYIGNPTNRDARSVRYQPAGVDKRIITSILMEVDDMASMVIQEPPSSPSQMAVFAKKSLPGGSETLRGPPPPGLGFALIQSPHHTSLGFSSFHVPPPPGIAGSSTPHQPMSHASSSEEEERKNDTDNVQHLGFGHRVGKKTTRFTPSDWQ
ncbi:hypothetical protein M9H77_13971 [Catharanthus roseus]|uniref:Uncharacterized protein n=1 Tax=Catharanthus roseus TaxID=4058 RepID=A0ACC0BLX0_CATRO|nr:hypothetical protein M9H77_13971 [Catharanthus roseus]